MTFKSIRNIDDATILIIHNINTRQNMYATMALYCQCEMKINTIGAVLVVSKYDILNENSPRFPVHAG